MTARIMILTVLMLALSGCGATRQWAYNQSMNFEKWRAGLVDRMVQTSDGITWHLLRSSEAPKSAPAVLLIHGFGGDSSNWLRFANELEGEYRFIIPDLPGHGQSTRSLTLNYGITEQAQRLFRLMDKLGIEQFSVVGNSTGGAIAIEMARLQPGRIPSLGLIDSAGITIVQPAFLNALEREPANPLIPQNAEDFKETLRWATYQGLDIPEFIILEMGERKAANAEVARRIWADLNKDPGMRLRNRGVLPAVKQPTLIVWGAEDRILGLDNLEAFQEELPNDRALIIPKAGSLAMLEAPEKCADAFRKFWHDVLPQVEAASN